MSASQILFMAVDHISNNKFMGIAENRSGVVESNDAQMEFRISNNNVEHFGEIIFAFWFVLIFYGWVHFSFGSSMSLDGFLWNE